MISSPHDCVAAVVRRIAGDEHPVQRIDAGGEQVDVRKAWQVHVGLLLKATLGREDVAFVALTIW